MLLRANGGDKENRHISGKLSGGTQKYTEDSVTHMRGVVEMELGHALDALKNLSYQVEKGDIEDKFSAVGSFLRYELDGVIQAVDEANDELKERSIIIDGLEVDLQKAQEELEELGRSVSVGDHA